MDFYDGAGWSGFFGAQVSPPATLTDLIFVAISINLKQVLQFPALLCRANPSTVPANAVLFSPTIAVAPGQPVEVLGSWLLVLGVAVAISVVALDLGTSRITEVHFRRRVMALSPIGLGATICKNQVLQDGPAAS